MAIAPTAAKNSTENSSQNYLKFGDGSSRNRHQTHCRGRRVGRGGRAEGKIREGEEFNTRAPRHKCKIRLRFEKRCSVFCVQCSDTEKEGNRANPLLSLTRTFTSFCRPRITRTQLAGPQSGGQAPRRCQSPFCSLISKEGGGINNCQFARRNPHFKNLFLK